MPGLSLPLLLLLTPSVEAKIHNGRVQCSLGGKELRFVEVSPKDEKHADIAKDVTAVFGKYSRAKIWSSPQLEAHFASKYFDLHVSPDSEKDEIKELKYTSVFEKTREAGAEATKLFEEATPFAWLSFASVWRTLSGKVWEQDRLRQTNWIAYNFDKAAIEKLAGDNSWEIKHAKDLEDYNYVTIGKSYLRYWPAKALSNPCVFANSVEALLYDPVSHMIIDPSGVGLDDLCKSVLHVPAGCTDVKHFAKTPNYLAQLQSEGAYHLKVPGHFVMCLDDMNIFSERDMHFMNLAGALIVEDLESKAYDPVDFFKDISDVLDDGLKEKYYECVIKGAERLKGFIWREVLDLLSKKDFVPPGARDKMRDVVGSWEGDPNPDGIRGWLVIMLCFAVAIGSLVGAYLQRRWREQRRARRRKFGESITASRSLELASLKKNSQVPMMPQYSSQDALPLQGLAQIKESMFVH